MREPQPKQPIDPAEEISALASYIPPRWDGMSGDFQPVVTRVFQRAGRIARGWFDQNGVAEPFDRLGKLRRSDVANALTGRAQEIGPEYDSTRRQLKRMRYGLDNLLDAARKLSDGTWNFSREADRLYSELEQSYPWLADVRPRGWEALWSGHEDFAGMTEWSQHEKDEEAAFEGHDLASLRSHGIVTASSLPHVMCSHRCQAIPAPRVLIGALLSHCLGMVQHNNTQALVREIEAQKLNDLESNVLFEARLSWSHPLLRALDEATRTIEENDPAFRGAYTPEAYSRSLSHVPKPMTKEERATYSRTIVNRILADEDGAQAAREASEQGVYRQSLLRELKRSDASPTPNP